jgi:hypothetical protein
MANYERLADGSLRTAIPEPFWERSLRTWFRYKPMCCNRIFRNRGAYEDHYVMNHIASSEEGSEDGRD